MLRELRERAADSNTAILAIDSADSLRFSYINGPASNARLVLPRAGCGLAPRRSASRRSTRRAYGRRLPGQPLDRRKGTTGRWHPHRGRAARRRGAWRRERRRGGVPGEARRPRTASGGRRRGTAARSIRAVFVLRPRHVHRRRRRGTGVHVDTARGSTVVLRPLPLFLGQGTHSPECGKFHGADTTARLPPDTRFRGQIHERVPHRTDISGGGHL